MNSNDETVSDNTPLCVDLDGTLIKTDMLFELLLITVKTNPLLILAIPLWLGRGKSYLKHQLALRCKYKVPVVPFNQEVLNYLQENKYQQPLVLVTGTNQMIAERVVHDLQLFDRVVGSDLTTNLTGEAKRLSLVRDYGEGGFDYIGNDEKDCSVWASARHSLAVSTPSGVIANQKNKFIKVFLIPELSIKTSLKLIRIHQWVKNFLIFVPLLLNQGFPNSKDSVNVVLAFLAMSLLASLTYIINDMLDLNADRKHQSKKHRPLANGSMSITQVSKLCLLLVLLLCACMTALPSSFNLLLATYLVVTLLYSFYFKHYAIVDVCVIASLLTMRVIGGTLVINAQWSFWLLAYCLFLFFSLAIAKRVSELINLRLENRTKAIARGYEVRDIGILTSLGVSSGFISVLVVALYFNSTKVIEMYRNPMALWFICPILTFWVGRLWLICDRGKLVEDPIEFAIRDRVSLCAASTLGIVLLIAKLA